MEKSVIILGANGRFGRSASAAYRDSGWQVTCMARAKPTSMESKDTTWIIGDVHDREALVRACEGKSVIVNAINPPYEQWAAELPAITANVIAAAKASGATVMIPGNIYNYGAEMPPVLKETTPHVAQTKKGLLRIEMERTYKQAAQDGVRTINLRSGDYIDVKDSGNWFETYITKKVDEGKIIFPGQTDIEHAWAYLPDVARAMVQLSEMREAFDPYEEFGFEGHTFSGQELVTLLSDTIGRKVMLKPMPWKLVWLMGLFSKKMFEIRELRYLWNTPHRVDGKKLDSVLPNFEPTPIERVLEQQFGKFRKQGEGPARGKQPIKGDAGQSAFHTSKLSAQ